MQIIKLDAIDSTNNYLRNLIHEIPVQDSTVIIAKKQTKGRGQMGTVWDSEGGKNLMFSVFKDLRPHIVEYPYYISMALALAILKALKTLNIPHLSIKWPNDILSADKKICGVLIENVMKDKLTSTILGIGLNVNQEKFNGLPRAASLKSIMGVHYDLEEVLKLILINIDFYSNLLVEKKFSEVKLEYEINLFRKDKPSTFREKDGKLFSGFIRGVNKYGKLRIEVEDRVIKIYDLKEVELMY